MPAGGEAYEVLAVRYGTRQTSAADVFLSYPVYGEPDRPLGMDYFFWVARSPSRTIVVDSGFSPEGGAARRRTTLMDMATALRAAGVNPAGRSSSRTRTTTTSAGSPRSGRPR